MTHSQLCSRALRWLRGTMRCEPVFCGIASCSEIPDAIGWTSRYPFNGSIVMECKTSKSDFYADKKKSVFWKHPEWGYNTRRPLRDEVALLADGYQKIIVSRMGDFRFYMCLPGVVTHEMVAEHAPDHGLLYVQGNRVMSQIQAPRRTEVDHAAEVRYLRFAIINSKKPWIPEQAQVIPGLSVAQK